MRKLVVSEFVSLDGVFEDPAWTFRFGSPEQERYKRDELFASDALLLGRVTYEAFAGAWPTMTDEQGFAERMNALPKHVATRTLKRFAWNNARALDGDVADAVRALKTEPGMDVLVGGSGELVATLAQHDLVDEYRLLVFPIVVGSGRRLFGSGFGEQTLRLVDATVFDSGVIAQTYAPVRVAAAAAAT